MACCILTAVIMNQLIRVCDALDVRFLQIKYNDEGGDACAPSGGPKDTTSDTCHITISGMTCSACSSGITQQLDGLDGVNRASVSLALGRATVSYDTFAVTPAEMVEAVNKVGYEASLEAQNVLETIERLNQSRELHDLRESMWSASICSTVIIGLEQLQGSTSLSRTAPRVEYMLVWAALLLAFKVQIMDAWPIHIRAWAWYAKQKMVMETLLSSSLLLGLGLALLQTFLGQNQGSTTYASSGSFLTLVILTGKYLEAVLKRESNSNLAALYELQTEKEMYQLTDSKISVPASLLRKGDDVLIRPQAIVPCDCFILEGSSAINESTITGESLPVVKTTGDFLLAGTKNLSSQIRIAISQDQSESSLAKVIESVAAATEQRLEGTEPLAIIMRYFVSGVFCLAAASFGAILWRRESKYPMELFIAACERASTVLAAACPCGIGLATPSAAMAGIDVAYSQGVLLGGGIRTMQALSETTHIVMDKTGTLTQGRLEVVDHRFSDDLKFNRQLCYRLLAAAEFEEARVHPVAKAVFKWALSHVQQSKSQQAIADTRNHTRVLGMGVNCEIKGHSDEWISVHVGRAAFLRENGISISSRQDIGDRDASTVHFAFGNRYAGYILVQDTIRPEASSVVTSLLRSGQQVTLLTGDNSTEAARISAQLGIRVLASRALPEDKVQHIKDLQQQGHHVVMVGDGINDALAQAAANVGVSISLTQGCLAGAGSVVLVSGNLHSLVALFAISKKVVKQAKINVWWALVYNVVALSMAVGLWEDWGIRITAGMAGTLMAGSSASVLGMSLWLRRELKYSDVMKA